MNSEETSKLGDVLAHDLATILDKNSGYKGSFAHSESRPDAPNPFLTITNTGSISLPLSEIDAKRIIACATQAPFGLGTSTVIDKEVRDTWQIDSSLVSFENSAWDSFLASCMANISSGLGLPGDYDIRCRLHKLLLYETGSHFRPHQDTQKEDGMFATMIIVLPSQYTGGEIIVSHNRLSKVLDVSASSMTSVSILSWYTDVMHEVKPITSGYRLVLSYNLMRSTLSGPEAVPTAKNTSELGRLHDILNRWRSGGYKQHPEKPIVAFVLEHQYSESDLDKGRAALKGQDAHKVNQIYSAAEMLGFELWLAKYERYMLREVEDDESDGGLIESGPPGFIIDDMCTLTYFTDLKGSRIHGKIDNFVKVGLIAGDANDIGDPDTETFHTGYKGNEAASIEYHYHRTALLIFNKEDMDRVNIITRGVNYVLDKLQLSLNQDNPTSENRKIADLLLEYSAMSEDIWKTMAQFPLQWHDLDLWNKTINRSIKHCTDPLDTLEQEIFLAWDIFGFQQVKSSYEAIVAEIHPIVDKIGFIHGIKARATGRDEQQVVETWCSEQIVEFMKGFSKYGRVLGLGNMNTLISIAKEDGIKFLKDFEGQRCRGHILEALIKLFVSEKDNIYASLPNQLASSNGEDLDQIFQGFLDKCILIVIQSLGDEVNTTYPGSRQSHQRRIDRILEVVELCITMNRVDGCAALFHLKWDPDDDPVQKLKLYYIPLTLRLHTQPQELGTSLLLPPFATFAQNVIGFYLSRVLGSKTAIPRPLAQRLLCSSRRCKTCASLREFFERLYVPSQDFSTTRKTRLHLVSVLSQLSSFVSFTEVAGGRYRVTKHQNLLNESRWETRLAQARDFLKSIGDDKFIEQLMGNRFKDLKLALEGKACYNYTGPLPSHEEAMADIADDDDDGSYVNDDTDDDMDDDMEEEEDDEGDDSDMSDE